MLTGETLLRTEAQSDGGIDSTWKAKNLSSTQRSGAHRRGIGLSRRTLRGKLTAK